MGGLGTKVISYIHVKTLSQKYTRTSSNDGNDLVNALKYVVGATYQSPIGETWTGCMQPTQVMPHIGIN